MKIKTVDENMQMMVIASVAFEANRQYCEMIGGKAFNPDWTEVDQSVRDSLIEAVKVALTDKIVSAELSHLRWMNVRIEQGWSFGPRLDPHRKTSPNLVPFRELSVQEQLKDILFLAIVNSLGAALGYREFDDDPLSPDTIQKHQETIADLENTATGKTDFVPAGEGDGKSIGAGPEDPEKPDEDPPLREQGAKFVDTIEEHTSDGSKPVGEAAKRLQEKLKTSTGQDPEKPEKPDEDPPESDEEFQTRQEEFHNVGQDGPNQVGDQLPGEGEKLGVVDTIEEHTSAEKPNVPAGEVSESPEPTVAPLPGAAGDQNPKGSVSEPTQAPAPSPDEIPEDMKEPDMDHDPLLESDKDQNPKGFIPPAAKPANKKPKKK